jgi:hypothetical protein
MSGIDPELFRPLGGRNVEVHDHRVAAAPHQHAVQGLFRAGVDLLVRDERRYEDEVARPGFGGELEAPRSTREEWPARGPSTMMA